MKANELSEKELRIGNKILGIYIDDCDNHIDERCTVLALDSIGTSEYKIWVESENTVYDNYDYFEGIPLNEDWLKRFGVKNDIDVWELTGVFWLQELEDGCFFLGCNSGWTGIEIKYVHQLQNLYFALTGEELKSLEK